MPRHDIDPREPKFRTIGNNPKTARLILQCSSCLVDIREIKNDETIDVSRAWYCPKCDTGTIIVNPSVEE